MMIMKDWRNGGGDVFELKQAKKKRCFTESNLLNRHPPNYVQGRK